MDDTNTDIFFSNDFIESTYSYSMTEKKLLLAVVKKTVESDVWGEEIMFEASEVTRLVGLTRHKTFDPAIKELMQKIITIPADSKWSPLKGVKDKKNGHTYVQFLGRSSYADGVFTTKVDPLLKPLFVELVECFTKYDLENIKPIRSERAIRLFELLKQFEGLGKREMTIESLRKWMRIENKYQTWKSLKKDLLEPVQKIIDKNCDISFEFEPVKRGRKHHSIIFTIFKTARGESVECSEPDEGSNEEECIEGEYVEVDLFPTVAEETPLGLIEVWLMNNFKLTLEDKVRELLDDWNRTEHEMVLEQLEKEMSKVKKPSAWCAKPKTWRDMLSTAIQQRRLNERTDEEKEFEALCLSGNQLEDHRTLYGKQTLEYRSKVSFERFCIGVTENKKKRMGIN